VTAGVVAVGTELSEVLSPTVCGVILVTLTSIGTGITSFNPTDLPSSLHCF